MRKANYWYKSSILKAITEKIHYLSKLRAKLEIATPNPNCKTPITPLATPAFFEKCSKCHSHTVSKNKCHHTHITCNNYYYKNKVDIFMKNQKY